MHAAALAPCLLALLSLPDIIPPGTRSVPLETKLEAAPLLERCCVQYVVVKGDTLEKIARERCGGAKDVRAILALNPDVKPSRMQIGERLWLPPKRALAEGEEPVFVYVEPGWPVHGTGAPFALGDPIRPGRNTQLAFLLVPKSQLAAYRAAGAKGAANVEKLAVDGKIQLLTTWGCGNRVPEGDPTAKLSQTFVITKEPEGKFVLQAQVTAFDEDGKVIEPGAEKKVKEPAKDGLWLLLLTAAGGGWLLLRTRRRSADLAPTAA